LKQRLHIIPLWLFFVLLPVGNTNAIGKIMQLNDIIGKILFYGRNNDELIDDNRLGFLRLMIGKVFSD
jgi:hypothetical protein